MSSLSILITSVLNSASDRLLISIFFSSFSGVLFWNLGGLPVFVSMYYVELLWFPVLVVWPIVERCTGKLNAAEP